MERALNLALLASVCVLLIISSRAPSVDCTLKFLIDQGEGPDLSCVKNERVVNALKFSEQHNEVLRPTVNHLTYGMPLIDESDSADGVQIEPMQSASTDNADDGRISQFLNSAIRALAPAQNYYQIMLRYSQWRKDYEALLQSTSQLDGQPTLRPKWEVLRLEYANVDKLLMEEDCPESSQPKAENLDFIFQVLKKLIDRLEKQVEQIKELGMDHPKNAAWCAAPESDNGQALQMDQETSEDTDEYVKEALDRAKRIAMKKVKQVTLGEIRSVFKVLLCRTLANKIQSSETGTILSYLEPAVIMIGLVDSPLLVGYLRDLQFRTAIGVLNYINPISLLSKCALNHLKN